MQPDRIITGSADEAPGLYIHVPFCKTKCPYCDFYSVTDAKSHTSLWLDGLKHEAELYLDDFGTFDTCYIGGGTPTVLSGDATKHLFEALYTSFAFKAGTEVTVEVNPDDVTADKLSQLKSLGVNRLSIGVQSFNENELHFLQRRHTAVAAEKACDLVRSSAISNFGIDLMYGLPGQTIPVWRKTLARALTFEPTHLSCYQLTIEPTTSFGKLKADGILVLPEEGEEQDFFLFTSRFLEKHGFIHYEISNFARDDQHLSRHNSKYWRHVDYLGLGPSAHSFQNGKRWWNHRSIDKYCKDLRERTRPIDGWETLSPEQLRLERLYLGLRTRDGIAMEDAYKGPRGDKVVVSLRDAGFIRVEGDRILPTRQGFLVADRLPLLFTD